ncbi:MAG: diguanylate cyclase [Hahellaceae bacterium]|nr:diguanylate cyclase [Hahellaceae bacterium]MCP5169891.1 diguanylate cyclase [Hahellaceae bacterium]
MSQTELSLFLRTRIYFWAAGMAGFLSLVSFVAGQTATGAITLVFTVLLALNSIYQPQPDVQKHSFLSHLIVIFLCIVTLGSLIWNERMAESWSFVVPLLLFLFYPVRLATRLVLSYSLLFVVCALVFYDTLERMQIIFNFLLCMGLTCMFVYLRETRESALKPLRRTDNLTLASTQEHLYYDLEKEIQRSEREGTSLAVLALGLDGGALTLREQRDPLLTQLGQCLHEQLRPFDTYYRWHNDEFLLILPNTGAKAALKKADKLRIHLRKILSSDEHKVSASVGVTAVNVGEDAQTLVDHALQALHESQAEKSNHCRLWQSKDEE